jgi:hypothetical protein
VADVLGEVAERFLAAHFRDDAVAVVVDDEAEVPLDALAGHRDSRRAGVDAVLDQLRDRLARVGLAAGEPADEVEGIVRLEREARPLLRPAHRRSG